MSLEKRSILHQLIIEADEDGDISRASRHVWNQIVEDGVIISTVLNIEPYESESKNGKPKGKIKDVIDESLGAALDGLNKGQAKKLEAIAAMDAALSQVEQLQSQVASLQEELDGLKNA